MSTITWTNTAGGDWSVAANWSSAGVPGAADDVAITLPGTYTVTQSGTVTVAGLLLADPSGTLDTNGNLNAGTLALDAGVLDLNGTLANTTVLDNGGTAQVVYETELSDVTWRGPLDLAVLPGSYAAVSIIGGLTVTGTDGVSPGVIDFSSWSFDILDDETFDNVTLNLGVLGFDAENFTLGAHAILNLTGDSDVRQTVGTLVNAGQINITGWFDAFSAAALFNTGTISISSGTVDFQIGSPFQTSPVPFDNAGVIEVAADAVINLSANQVTPGSLGTLRIGGRFLLQGNLDNIGGTITVAAGGSFDQLTLNGTLEGGTIVAQGGTLIGDGTLAGVISVGTFDVTGFWMVDGATQFDADAAGHAAIQMTNGQLEFLTTRILDNLVITAAGSDLISADFGTLTLDPTVSLISNAATVSFEGTVTNQGSIEVTGSTDVLYLNQNFTNAGWIGIENGAAVNGSLANTGTILLSGGKTSLAVTGTGLNQGSIEATGTDDVINLGTSFTNAGWIGIQNSSTLIVGAYSGPPGGVINTGTIALGNSSTTLELYGSQSLANLGSITGAGANLIVGGTLDNTGGTLMLAPNASFGALSLGYGGLVQGGTVIDNGGTFTPGGTLANLTWRGPLDVTKDLLYVNNVAFQSEDGDGPGNVALDSGIFYVLDGGTLDGVSLVASGGTSEIVGENTPWPGVFFLTIGTTATIDVTNGSSLTLHGTTVTNLGTIDATGPGATASVQSYYEGAAVSFVNAGLVNITNGGLFQFLATADQQGSLFLSQTIDNSGLIEIASGGTFEAGAYMSGITNTGTINLNGATSTLKLDGTVIAATLGLVTGDGVLAIDGLYDNTGETLTIGP